MSLNLKNHILSSIKSENVQRILPYLEEIEMNLSQIIYTPGSKLTHVYFPETSVISVVTYLENGDCVETGIIGNEGMSGIEIMLGADCSPREAMVQHAGAGSRMKVEHFKSFIESNMIPSEVVLRFIYSFIGQISQNPACLSYHKIERRLARWLVMFQDRVGCDKLRLTQEFIALMLGVHRPSVSKSAARLQDLNLIRYNRGKINILDRAGLMDFSCECLRVIERQIA